MSATQKLFEDIEQFIAESNSLLEQGAMMELAGLDDRVRILCEEVLRLSQDDRLKYAEQLQKLFNDLKGLGESMVAQRDAIAGEIKNMAHHRKASVAYRTTEVNKPEEK